MARARKLSPGQKRNAGELPPEQKEAVTTGLPVTLSEPPPKSGLQLYSPELGERICELIAAGVTMTKLCTLEGMPARMTLWRWLSGRVPGVPSDFRERFNEARKLHLAFMASEILDIADDGTNDTYIDEKGNRRIDSDVIARSRLRVETRQWLLALLVPEQFQKKAHYEQQREMKRLSDLSESELNSLLIDLEAQHGDVESAAGGALKPEAAPAPAGRAKGGEGKAVH